MILKPNRRASGFKIEKKKRGGGKKKGIFGGGGGGGGQKLLMELRDRGQIGRREKGNEGKKPLKSRGFKEQKRWQKGEIAPPTRAIQGQYEKNLFQGSGARSELKPKNSQIQNWKYVDRRALLTAKGKG